MTGGAFTPDTVEFIERTAPPVLTKPFDKAALLALIRDRTRVPVPSPR
jgi:DNA-binding response OmpR family regulator